MLGIMDLKLNSSVAEFFHDRGRRGHPQPGRRATTPTECYLVNLLADFTKSPPDDQPLALKLAAAVSSPDERVRQLKDVGDTSLYVSGFFADSLQRKLVDVDYYIQMGGAAYGELARYFRGNPQLGGVRRGLRRARHASSRASSTSSPRSPRTR